MRVLVCLLGVACAVEEAVPPEVEASPAASAAAVATTESPPVAALGGQGSPLLYRLSFPDHAQHMIDVRLDVEAAGRDQIELWMATWTPGSYLIREYSRQVEGVRAQSADGQSLDIERVAKNRWVVDTTGADKVSVSYRVYAREPSVRSNYVDADMGVINGAALFMTVRDMEARPHRVALALPEAWPDVATGLDPASGTSEQAFVAADFDELVDSPLVLGSLVRRTLAVEGVPHELVLTGELGPWNVEQSAKDVAAIVAVQQKFWGDVPYDHYSFLNVVNETRGGLEHLDSTLMMSSRFATSTREDYVGWLGLVSHEFFHTWNVKRLRPAPLGPFDYENEVVTPSLWIAEGITSYYDDLLLVRAGLITEKEYLGRLSDSIAKLSDTPGRQVQTLQQASADAWIKHYRRDENTVNTAISYYTKGAMVGWLLDAEIRRSTSGERSLDDVMRMAYARYGGERGYTPEEFEALVEEMAGRSLDAELDHWLRSTRDLDYSSALDWFGLQLEADGEEEAEESSGDAPRDPPAGWMGAELEAQSGRWMVTVVRRGTPAHDAGLQVGDELIAVRDWRVPSVGPDALWKVIPIDEPSVVTVSRRGVIRQLPVTFVEAPKTMTKVTVSDADADAQNARKEWLQSPESE